MITSLFYIGIVSYTIGGLPNLTGDKGGEWTKVTLDDFGLKDGATCLEQNPWMVKFEDILARAGFNIMFILIVQRTSSSLSPAPGPTPPRLVQRSLPARMTRHRHCQVTRDQRCRRVVLVFACAFVRSYGGVGRCSPRSGL